MDDFQLDASSLTLGEFAVFEAVAGLDISEVLEAVEDGTGVWSPSFLIALVTVVRNRTDDTFTVSDATGLTLNDLGAVSG